MLDTLSRIFGLQTLKHRLRFWVSAIVVVMGLLILVSTYLQEARIRDSEIRRQLRETMALQRLSIENWISDHSSQVRYLARMLSGPDVDYLEISTRFQSFIYSQDQFASVVYADARGRTQVDSNGAPSVDVSDRDYFQAAKEGREFVTDVITSKTTGKPVVIFSSPVKDAAGSFKGLVFGTIQIQTLEQMMRLFDFGGTGESYLLDRHGQAITSPERSSDASFLNHNASQIYRLAASGAASDKPYRNYRGVTVLGEYSWTKEHQWLIVAEIEHKAVFQPLYRNMLTVSAIVAGVLLVSVWLILALARGIERPIRFLLVGTKIIREGNYDYRVAEEEIKAAPVELKQLCEAFNLTGQRLKSTIQMLEQTAVIDQLTEVYNRRFIMNEGSKVLEACIRGDQPCSVLMIDIDLFKKVNDTYGHLVGDRVIIHTASILMACIRSWDLVSRYGGEEFLILAPNTEANPGGLQLGERIRRHLEEHPYREDGVEIPLTVSIGVAGYCRKGSLGKTALEDMISRADEALYRAKRGGRNRVDILEDSSSMRNVK